MSLNKYEQAEQLREKTILLKVRSNKVSKNQQKNLQKGVEDAYYEYYNYVHKNFTDDEIKKAGGDKGTFMSDTFIKNLMKLSSSGKQPVTNFKYGSSYGTPGATSKKTTDAVSPKKWKFSEDNRSYSSPNDTNSFNPYRHNSYNHIKFEVEKTVKHIDSCLNTKTKVVLLTDENKQSNYNKKLNVVFVNPIDQRRYDKLNELIRDKSNKKKER